MLSTQPAGLEFPLLPFPAIARPATPTVIPTDANTMAATRRGPVMVERRLGIRLEISETR